MHKNLKKLTVLALATVMAFSLLSFSLYAEETGSTDVVVEETDPSLSLSETSTALSTLSSEVNLLSNTSSTTMGCFEVYYDYDNASGVSYTSISASSSNSPCTWKTTIVSLQRIAIVPEYNLIMPTKPPAAL